MANKLFQLISKAFSALKTEETVIHTLHEDVQATLERLQQEDPGLKQLLEDAHGYAVFPSVGKASLVVGGAFGKGEVFEKGKLVGYAGIGQLTLGVQVGGETFSEIIAFENEQALERFKAGKLRWAANAAAVLVKAGAASSANYEKGAAVFVYADGGMILELAIGGQKFMFKPAVLGRAEGKTAKSKTEKPESSSGESARRRRTPGKQTREHPRPKSKARPSARGRSQSSSRGKRSRSTGATARRRRTSAKSRA